MNGSDSSFLLHPFFLWPDARMAEHANQTREDRLVVSGGRHARVHRRGTGTKLSLHAAVARRQSSQRVDAIYIARPSAGVRQLVQPVHVAGGRSSEPRVTVPERLRQSAVRFGKRT